MRVSPGPSHVLGVDASELGVAQARENAALNGLSDRVEFLCADVFALLPELEAKGQKFDLVILDPPAFTKSRASVKKAVTGYREINLRAMKLIRDGGFLATCSCSHFVDYELFTQTIGQARPECPQAAAAGGIPHPGAGSPHFVGRRGFLLPEILHFSGLRREITNGSHHVFV